MTLSDIYLRFGMRFPLNPFFVAILRYFGLTIFQIMPNGWAHMIGLFGLFVQKRLGPPSVEEFTWFYLVKSNKGDDGFYYFSKRPAKGLHTVVHIKDNMRPWK